MNRKPWSIIFFSIVFLLIPIFNIVFTYYSLPGDYLFSDYLYSIFFLPSNWFPLFNLIVPSLIASYAVYSIKNWSIPVFLGAMIWIIIYSFIDIYIHHTLIKSISITILPIISNALFIYYILIPNVRAAYLNPRLRWWESKPRYVINEKVEIKKENISDDVVEAKMNNFSEGGMFLSSESAFEVGSFVHISFTILEKIFSMKGEVVHHVPTIHAYGIKFVELKKHEIKELQLLCLELKNKKFPETRPQIDWRDDLKKWFTELRKTGKGIVPELPEKK